MTVKELEKPKEEEIDPEVTNDPENPPDPENPDDESKPTGEEDSDDEGEGGKAGKGVKGDEDETPEPDANTQKIAELQEKIRALEAPKPPEVKPWTDEDWAKHEEKTGLTKGQTQWIGQLIHHAMGQLRTENAELKRHLASTQKNGVLEAMAKKPGFEDILSHTEGINEFLEDFEPHLHNNENLLRKAYIYARGLASDAKLKGVITSKEVRRKIVSKSKMQTPTPTPKKGGMNLKLSASEESAYQSFGRHSFSSREEYAKSLPRNRDKGS